MTPPKHISEDESRLIIERYKDHVLSGRQVDLRGSPPFERLSVIAYAGQTKNHTSLWLCRCSCGNMCLANSRSLKIGSIRSCGCILKEMASKLSYKHGHASKGMNTPEYKTWSWMISRCENPNATHYEYYGGRGIRICKGWRDDYVKFFTDMGYRPSDRHSIDRLHNEGNYSCGHCDECVANSWPANCKWSTDEEQQRNTRRSRLVEYKGRMLSVSQLSKLPECSVNFYTIKSRIADGWPVEEAVITAKLPPMPRRRRYKKAG